MLKYRNESVQMPYKKMRGNAKKLTDDDVAAAAKFYAAQPK
jgi:cytochrome c553